MRILKTQILDTKYLSFDKRKRLHHVSKIQSQATPGPSKRKHVPPCLNLRALKGLKQNHVHSEQKNRSRDKISPESSVRSYRVDPFLGLSSPICKERELTHLASTCEGCN